MKKLVTLLLAGVVSSSSAQIIYNMGSVYSAQFPYRQEPGGGPYDLFLNVDSQLDIEMFPGGNYSDSFTVDPHGGDLYLSDTDASNPSLRPFTQFGGEVGSNRYYDPISTAELSFQSSVGWQNPIFPPAYYAFRLADQTVTNFHYGWLHYDGTTFDEYAVNLTPNEHVIVGDTSYYDNDLDGLNDPWEVQHFDHISNTTANADSDLDGYSNIEEYNNETDPNNPDIYLEHSTAIELVWKSLAGSNYVVLGSDNLESNSWEDLSGIITGNGSTNTYLLSTRGSDKKFFRVIMQD